MATKKELVVTNNFYTGTYITVNLFVEFKHIISNLYKIRRLLYINASKMLKWVSQSSTVPILRYTQNKRTM
jgi:hypothetical protein